MVKEIDSVGCDAGQMRTLVVKSSAVGKWDVVSQLVVRARAEDDGKNVSCRAHHPGIRGMGIIATSITLSIPREYKCIAYGVACKTSSHCETVKGIFCLIDYCICI